MIYQSHKPNAQPNILLHILGGVAFLLVTVGLYFADLPLPNASVIISVFVFVHLVVGGILSRIPVTKGDFLIGYIMAMPSLLLFIALFIIELIIHPPSEE